MEKKKLNRFRLIFLIIFVLTVALPIILFNCKGDLEMLDCSVYSEYNEYSNYSNCSIELTFNKKVDYGSATFIFYDKSGKWLDSEKVYFWEEEGTVVTSEVSYISGEIDSYEITNIDFNRKKGFLDYSLLLLYLTPVSLFFLLSSFLSSCKEYNYNGYKIVVYAGAYKHYLKVNDVKVDEYNTSFSFTPIKLSSNLDNGDLIEATISLSNRIALKVNNKLFID